MKQSTYKTFFALITLFIASCNTSPVYNVKNGILVSNATIISAQGNESIGSYTGHILIEADTIIYSGQDLPRVNGNLEIIDAKGKFVIPGLIDSHVHLGHAITLKDEHYETKPELVKSYQKQLPRSYLYFGFTSLIDLDLNERVRNQFQSATIRPDLFSTSRGIRYFNGYGPGLFPENVRLKYFPRWIYDESQIPLIPVGTDLSEHSVTAVVQQTVNDNAIGLKTYYEKGFGGVFDWPVPSDSLLSSLVKEAHRNKLPVVLHATSYDAYKKGLQAGIDIFGHGLWHWEGDKLNTNPPVEISELYKEIAERNIYVQSTMRVILGEYDTYTWALVDHPDLKHVFREDFIAWLNSDEGKWSQNELKELYSSVIKDTTENNEAYLLSFNQRVKNTVSLANDKGVKLILGSDTPAQEGLGNIPGLNGFMEIKALSDAGVDNETIFLAGTIRNAMAFNLQGEIGSIATGKRANILILQENPLEDVNAYNKIESVMISGRLFAREELSAAYLSN